MEKRAHLGEIILAPFIIPIISLNELLVNQLKYSYLNKTMRSNLIMAAACGSPQPVLSPSYRSSHMLYNLQVNTWSQPLSQVCSISFHS